VQEKFPMSRKGTLHTFARSHMGPSGLPTPYTIGFIELPEGIKLFSLLTQCDPWDKVLSVGMAMEMVIETIREDEEGNGIVGYKFRPSGEKSS
jgi:benzoylsuccinyl-CoA thiolase BbsA subunit